MPRRYNDPYREPGRDTKVEPASAALDSTSTTVHWLRSACRTQRSLLDIRSGDERLSRRAKIHARPVCCPLESDLEIGSRRNLTKAQQWSRVPSLATEIQAPATTGKSLGARICRLSNRDGRPWLPWIPRFPDCRCNEAIPCAQTLRLRRLADAARTRPWRNLGDRGGNPSHPACESKTVANPKNQSTKLSRLRGILIWNRTPIERHFVQSNRK